jgi:hypothetical protein
MPVSPPPLTLMDPAQCYPIVTTIFFIIIYIVCFIGLFSPKSEMVATGMLMALSIMSIIYIIPQSFANNSNIYFLPGVVSKSVSDQISPLIGSSTIGILQCSTVFIIIGGMLLASVALLLASFAKVRDNAMADRKSVGIDFGNQRASVDASKRIIATASVLMWALHITCDNRSAILAFMKDYLSPEFSSSARGASLAQRAKEADVAKIDNFSTLISAATVAILIACITTTAGVATLVGAIPRL